MTSILIHHVINNVAVFYSVWTWFLISANKKKFHDFVRVCPYFYFLSYSLWVCLHSFEYIGTKIFPLPSLKRWYRYHSNSPTTSNELLFSVNRWASWDREWIHVMRTRMTPEQQKKNCWRQTNRTSKLNSNRRYFHFRLTHFSIFDLYSLENDEFLLVFDSSILISSDWHDKNIISFHVITCLVFISYYFELQRHRHLAK